MFPYFELYIPKDGRNSLNAWKIIEQQDGAIDNYSLQGISEMIDVYDLDTALQS